MKYITDSIVNIGVDDFEIGNFEGQYPVPLGISYNSYLVLDEKVAVFDAVDVNFCDEWLLNLEKSLGGREVDYLIILHMEPDHSGSLGEFIKKYPNALIVSTAKSFDMISRFFPNACDLHRLDVKEGDTLSTGKHSFKFFMAPMVHWPEVMVAYESTERVLFSADAFGTFGVYKEDDEILPSVWADEACRYYIGIVGKYGMQVQALLKKLGGLSIEIICSLHGPALKGNIEDYINYYDIWSCYRAEKEGVFIGYCSIYGNTEKAVLHFAKKLEESGICDIAVYKITLENKSIAISQAFRYGKILLASPTYNMSIFPHMHSFIHGLVERNFQNKFIGFMENTSWAPNAIKTMKAMVEGCKNLEFAENDVTIKGDADSNEKKMIEKLAAEFVNKLS